MTEEKQSFKDNRLYPILFMMAVTVFFVGILALFYHSTKERVRDYEKSVFHKSLLLSFNLPVDNIENNYQKYIKEVHNEQLTYYQAKDDNRLIGYAFIIKGNGLWGGIQGIIALSPDYKQIINLVISNQNETPGLGARIVEPWFTDQFKSKPIVTDKGVLRYKLVTENTAKLSNNEIKQVTGATLSSKSVIDMLYSEVQKIIIQLKVTHE